MMVTRSSTLETAGKGSRPPHFLPPLLLLLVIAGLFFAIKWEDVVRQRDDGSWELQEWRTRELEKELERNEEAEQYRLIAKRSDYYLCYFCENGRTWVNAGETLKIGVTTNRDNRFKPDWLQQMNAHYEIDAVGDLAAMRREEIRKIATYPLWPENLNRPKDQRLVVPPFHKTIRLK